MSTMTKKMPVVTYKLLTVFERKLSNKKVAEEHLAKIRDAEIVLREAKEENEKRLAEKKVLRQEIKRTHVIPSSFLEQKREKKRAEKLMFAESFENCLEESRLEQSYARTAAEKAEQMKKLKEKIRLEKIIPIGVKKLLARFEEIDVEKVETLECEKLLGPVLATFARTIGFVVKKIEKEGKTDLEIKRPYPMRLL
jgi:hypothetical protein